MILEYFFTKNIFLLVCAEGRPCSTMISNKRKKTSTRHPFPATSEVVRATMVPEVSLFRHQQLSDSLLRGLEFRGPNDRAKRFISGSERAPSSGEAAGSEHTRRRALSTAEHTGRRAPNTPDSVKTRLCSITSGRRWGGTARMERKGDGYVREGTGRHGAERDGTGRDGTGREGTGRDRTAREGTGRDETERDGTERNGTGRNGTGRNRTGRDGTGRDGGTGRHGTERDETGRHGTGRDGTGRNGTGRDGTERTGRNGTKQDGTGRDGTKRNGTERNGSGAAGRGGVSPREEQMVAGRLMNGPTLIVARHPPPRRPPWSRESGNIRLHAEGSRLAASTGGDRLSLEDPRATRTRTR